MNNNIVSVINKKPKLIFLIDGIGALVSSFFLLIILVHFEQILGLPKVYLRVLGLLAIGYSIYSLLCFIFLKTKIRLFLKILASANLIHCGLTFVLLIYNRQSISLFGIAYFTIEMIIIFFLIIIEWKIAYKNN